ncbi:hypothetical protein MIR68_007029 [Amoeboaphelidium protococcarum]|nr:hypothetical protein MIR68_007029 [Amoeboaphelidium protococcarum]
MDQQLIRDLTKFVSKCLLKEKEYEDEVELNTKNGKRWAIQPQVMEHLKAEARKLDLWNLFIHKKYSQQLQTLGISQKYTLTHEQYAQVCEIIGRSFLAPEATNTNAPDSGNIEVLLKYASDSQKQQYLVPLLRGEIRSAFAMTEPQVASSDALNIACTLSRKSSDGGNQMVLNGRKWWISNGGHPNLRVLLVLCLDQTITGGAARHRRHTIVLIPKDAPGIRFIRPMCVFGHDDAVEGHWEIEFDNVPVRQEDVIYKQGAGFEIIQSRLGGGRIHHCMRAIGMAERAMEAMILRANERVAFGKKLIENAVVIHQIAQCRIQINQARLSVLHAASLLDQNDLKQVYVHVGIIKASVPQILCNVIDQAIQIHGGMGLSQDTFLARAYVLARSLRIADGPDDVHLNQVGRTEIKRTLLRLQQSKL